MQIQRHELLFAPIDMLMLASCVFELEIWRKETKEFVDGDV